MGAALVVLRRKPRSWAWRLGYQLGRFRIPPDRVIAARFPFLNPTTSLLAVAMLKALVIAVCAHQIFPSSHP